LIPEGLIGIFIFFVYLPLRNNHHYAFEFPYNAKKDDEMLFFLFKSGVRDIKPCVRDKYLFGVLNIY